MKNRRIIIWLSVLLPLAVIAFYRNVFIPWLDVMAVQWIYLLRTGAVLIVCCGLFYLFNPPQDAFFGLLFSCWHYCSFYKNPIICSTTNLKTMTMM